MTSVFADTLYWFARAVPNDQWHADAMKAEQKLGDRPIVTTEAVLMEFMTSLAGQGPFLRKKAVLSVRAIQTHLDIEIVEMNHDLFEAGLKLYEQRPDKEYSLVDCISMVVMREREILEVLTHDHHFAQEGFLRLL